MRAIIDRVVRALGVNSGAATGRLLRRAPALLIVLSLLLAACGNGSSGDLLAKIQSAAKIRVGTDSAYPPQSERLPDGTFRGFDIDVANEIGKRLGVSVEFVTPDFSTVVAGGWGDKYDISVGSVAITKPRQAVLDFTKPYYYTPAQMSATKASGITTLAGMAGKTVCVSASSANQSWLEGTLMIVGSVPAPVPAGIKVVVVAEDSKCIARTDIDGWVADAPVIAHAITQGAPFVTVGAPVFYGALALATDKAALPHTELLAELNKIVQAMHDDGTLTKLSKQWFEGLDLSKNK